MFPIRDDNPAILVPYATIGLIVLNALAWFLVQGMGSEQALAASICRLGLVPGELLHTVATGTRFAVGAGRACVISDSAAWYTVLTSMFLHGGWLHIIGNMWFLWIFGNNVEDVMGPARFVVFYLLCGVAAAAAQTAANPESVAPMVGASGAIGGVMGAYILLFPRVHVHLLIVFGFYVTTIAVPAIFMLGYWFLIQLLSGFLSAGADGGGVAFWAHVGGFFAGAALVLLFRKPELIARHPYHGWHQRRSPGRSWHRPHR